MDAGQDCGVRLAHFVVGENAKSAEQICIRSNTDQSIQASLPQVQVEAIQGGR